MSEPTDDPDATNDGETLFEPLPPPELKRDLILAGRYKLIEQIGRGGMGVVWSAVDLTVEGRKVVLKFVPRALSNFAEAVDQVMTTFQKVCDLHHQHLCPVYDIVYDREFGNYLVMQWLNGETLDKYVARTLKPEGQKQPNPMPLDEALRILRPVAEALDYAHCKGIIHRDIKPHNIFLVLDKSQQIKDVQVIDFGIADEIKESLTRVSQLTFSKSGSRPYMAPEQWQGEEQTAATDQYALSVVAYELLAGHLPFRGSDDFQLGFAVLNVPPKPIAGQPEHVNAAILKALSKDREERFGSCGEFFKALAAPEEVIVFSPPPDIVLPQAYVNNLGMSFACIVAGEFMMGDTLTPKEVDKKYPGGNVEWYSDAHPRHKVILSHSFYMGTLQVTVSEFRQFVTATNYQTTAEKTGKSWGFAYDKDGWFKKGGKWTWQEVKGLSWKNPGFDQTGTHPVVCVSWDDAIAFIAWLNANHLPRELWSHGMKYSLPTEAQWEYSCRAGTTTDFFWGDTAAGGDGYINAADQSGHPGGGQWNYAFPFKSGYTATAPVGSFKSNPWGLYDMLGNVWEWCNDWYGVYPSGNVTDPAGVATGSNRVFRGGSWSINARSSRSASRNYFTPSYQGTNLGLRLVLVRENQ